MSSSETLTPKSIKDEDKIRLSLSGKYVLCIPLIYLLISGIGTGVVALYFSFNFFSLGIIFGPGAISIFSIVMFILILRKIDGAIITINNKNNTLKIQKSYGFCFKKNTKIINIEEIEKIKNSLFNKCCIIIYKNGKKEDISEYFAVCSDNSRIVRQNFFKKYFNVENLNINEAYDFKNKIISPYNPMVSGYNSYTTSNQLNICYMPQGVDQNYNQQDYNAENNFYINNIVVDNNQNNPIQQNLEVDDNVSKPQPTDPENYGAPSVG